MVEFFFNAIFIVLMSICVYGYYTLTPEKLKESDAVPDFPHETREDIQRVALRAFKFWTVLYIIVGCVFYLI